MQQQSSVSGEQSVTSGATCTSSPAKTGTQTSSMFPLTYIVPFTLLRAIETLAAVTAVVEVGFCARLKWVLIDIGIAKSTNEELTSKIFETSQLIWLMSKNAITRKCFHRGR